MYGIFSQAFIPEEVTRLHRVEETPQEALIWMGRYVLYSAFGILEPPDIEQLVETLYKFIDTEDISKVVRVDGIDFFVEKLDDDALTADLNENEKGA
jgi:hypothetical protein